MMIILGIFGIGTVWINNNNQFQIIRIIGLICFALFSWLQIVAYRSLGDSYAPDIVVLKNHKLQTRGVYRFIRHPQYLGQLLSDLSAGIALMSFVVVPMVLLLELPLFIIRAYEEEKILTNYFKDEYKSYKKKSGFFLPFVG